MQKYVKFLRRLPKPLRSRLIAVIEKIVKNDLKNLDSKPLVSASGNFYRCRVGKIRIIFEKGEAGNIIYDIGFRGDIYD